MSNKNFIELPSGNENEDTPITEKNKPVNPISFDPKRSLPEDEPKLINPLLFDQEGAPIEEKMQLVDPIIFNPKRDLLEKESTLINPILFDQKDVEEGIKLIDPIVFGQAGNDLEVEDSLPEKEPPSVSTPANTVPPSSTLSGVIVPGDAVGNSGGYNIFNYIDNKSLSIVPAKAEDPPAILVASFEKKQPASADPGIVMNCEKPRPYDVAQKIKRTYMLRVVGDCLYGFTGKYYQYLPMDKALQLIYSTCEKEVALVGNDSIVRGAYTLLLIDPELCISPRKPETEYAVFENGILRLSDGVLLEHTSELFITVSVKANYTPKNTNCPLFDKFLHDLTDGNPQLTELFLQMFGYCLVPDPGAKALFDLYGPSGTGKSTVLELIQLFFDLEDITSIELAELRNQFAASELIGKALCISPDLADKSLDPYVVGLIKRMTGGDLMTADRKHQTRAKFYNTAKLIVVRNGMLRIDKQDEAFLTRIVSLPCRHVIPVEARQKDFAKQLAGEVDAIASKAIQAYLRLRANHYKFAGEYQVSGVIVSNQMSTNETSLISTENCIKEFLVKNYEQHAEGVVFTEDVYREFVGLHPGLDYNAFSRCYGKLIETVFAVKKDRKRRQGCTNPQSCVLGIQHVNSEGSLS